MNEKSIKRWIILPLAAALAIGYAVAMLRKKPEFQTGLQWQPMVSSGALSTAHAFLGTNCTACHTPLKGVEAANCITCHANNQALLQRQPTAFHANVRSCIECHSEHHGPGRLLTKMDHAALAEISLRQVEARSATRPSDDPMREQIVAWMSQHRGNTAMPLGHPSLKPQETALSCITCHANQDRHRGLFGTDCIQCHTTAAWKIPEFRHPPPTSVSCVQCHQAPPSHYMMHFKMISMKIAGQEHAIVSECFKCHQTTAWNDIKDVGWYKHH